MILKTKKTMKITNKQALDAKVNLETIEFKDAGNRYAQKRNLAMLMPIFNKYTEAIEDIRDLNSCKDAKGFILLEENGQYKHNADSLLKTKKEIRELSTVEVDFEPYLFSLNDEIKELHVSFHFVFDFLLPKETAE